MDQPPIRQTENQQPEGSAPLEVPPDIKPSEPMGGRPSGEFQKEFGRGPSPEKPPRELIVPRRPIGSYLLMAFLLVVLGIGILLFAGWKGWISLGGLNNLFGGKPSPAPTPTIVLSPETSPITSPTLATSPQVIANVNDETRKKDLANIKAALKNYYADKAAYPQTYGAVVKTSDQSSVLNQALVPQYLERLPDDPQAPQYYYGYKSDGQSYELTCVLEDKSDSAGTISGNLNIYKITNLSSE